MILIILHVLLPVNLVKPFAPLMSLDSSRRLMTFGHTVCACRFVFNMNNICLLIKEMLFQQHLRNVSLTLEDILNKSVRFIIH